MTERRSLVEDDFFNDDFFGGGGRMGGGLPALHGMPSFPTNMMTFQGPDVMTTRHHFSDSMNFTDSKDGVSGGLQADTQSSQMSSTNQSVDPITGQSTSSTFFSSSYSSSSTTNNNNSLLGGGGGGSGGGFHHATG